MLWNPAATQGYPYEIVGLLYYLMFLFMGSKRSRGRFSPRSRVLTLIAAIVLVGSVPFGYAVHPAGILAMFALAIAALISTLFDRRA